MQLPFIVMQTKHIKNNMCEETRLMKSLNLHILTDERKITLTFCKTKSHVVQLPEQ